MGNGDIIGFIGLGNMGGPMCERLLAAGHQVVAFDLDDAKVTHAAAHGAQPAESGADCAARADVLLTSLPRPDHVEAVMVAGGALAALRSWTPAIDPAAMSASSMWPSASKTTPVSHFAWMATGRRRGK